MILVPLLVGIAILVVAHTSRREEGTAAGWLKEQLTEIDLEIGERPRNPLIEAYPHLQLWVPEQDAIYQATHKIEGAAGPDIIIRGLSDAA